MLSACRALMCCPTLMLPEPRLSFTFARCDIILAFAVEFLIWRRESGQGEGKS